MKNKHIVILLIVAVLLLGLARLTSSRRQARPSAQIGRPVLADLKVNDVRAIEIRDSGGVLRAQRDGDIWSVTNAFGYPADFTKLRERLIALKEMKVGQVQRGLSIESNDAAHITLFDGNGRAMAGLTLGAQRQSSAGGDSPMGGYRRPEGRYVRTDGRDTICLVKESLDGWSTTADQWIDTQLLTLSSADIATIELQPPLGDAVRLDRSTGSLVLEGLDAATEALDTSRIYGIESALSYLRFDAVADPALDAGTTGVETGHLFRVSLKNGEAYTARIGNTAAGGSDRYLKLAVDLAPATTNDAARLAQETRVAELSAKFKPWTFLISSYTADNMTRQRADLVKAKPAETNTTSEVSATTDAATDAAPAVHAADETEE